MGREIRTIFGFIYIQMWMSLFLCIKIKSQWQYISTSTWAFPYFKGIYGSFHITVYLNLPSVWLFAVVSLSSFCLFSSFSKAAFRNGVEKRRITSWSCSITSLLTWEGRWKGFVCSATREALRIAHVEQIGAVLPVQVTCSARCSPQHRAWGHSQCQAGHGDRVKRGLGSVLWSSRQGSHVNSGNSTFAICVFSDAEGRLVRLGGWHITKATQFVCEGGSWLPWRDNMFEKA